LRFAPFIICAIFNKLAIVEFSVSLTPGRAVDRHGLA